MARLLPNPASPLITHFITISILISLVTIPATGENHGFVKAINRKKLGLRKEKLTHFRVYWHDVISGSNASVVSVTQPSNKSTTAFGNIRVIDDALTEGPEPSSKLVGRAQGFYAAASQQEIGLLMAMNFAFIEGKYNGSTITVLGRNPVFNKMREMPVIGGSGLFRFARGYVQIKTHQFNLTTGDAIVEYNVYALESRFMLFTIQCGFGTFLGHGK
ncbi:hypothetical protein F0562_001352 [Nyssa sinensis]|uniref:Dirigent protein n=1 Tax=Nyssa sinensis TaxID=561372 RepID=A0A5J5C6P4_9ASTE|nr:hypothetical protein F0562_001352 [Nyssa sinensis]